MDMALRDQLKKYLLENTEFPEDLIAYLPSGFQQLSHRAILNLQLPILPYAQMIAEAIPKVVPQIIAVWNRTGIIEGPFREPAGLTYLWGDPSTEIINHENGIKYKFDFTKIMFAKGNVNERAYIPTTLQPGEIIIDMFSGIGYFTLGMAKSRKPKHIYAIEWNPTSFHYLQENLKLNHVEDMVTPINGDNKIETPKLVSQGIKADRILMGLLPAPKDCIPAALTAIKSEGTIVLYEGIEPEVSTQLFDEFTQVANEHGFQTILKERRIVKSYAPKLFHIVVEIIVKPK